MLDVNIQPTLVNIVPSFAPIGGIARASLEVSRALFESGWNVQCVYRKTGELEKEWRHFAQVHRFQSLSISLRSPSRLIGFLRAVERLPIRRGSLIYAHSYSHFEMASYIAARKQSKLALHLHSDPVALSWRQRRAIDRAGVKIAVSVETAHHWRDRFGVSGVEVVPNGIDLRKFSRVDSRRTTSEEPFRVLFLGRTEPEKGFDTAVEAFRIAQSSLPGGSRLTVVGGSWSMAHSVWADGIMAGLLDQIRVVGVVDDVVDFLSDCDVLVMPSRTEAFGRVAVEAMACGIPVIGSRVGGLEGLLDGVYANRLVESSSASASARFAQELVDLSSGRPYLDSAVAASRERAANFSIERTGVKIDQLFRAALEA